MISNINSYAQTWAYEFPYNNAVFQKGLIDSDSGLLVAVATDPPSVNLLKLDVNGNLLWKRGYYINSKIIFPYEITTDNDGNYLVAGFIFFSDSIQTAPVILKLDKCFNPIESIVYLRPGNLGALVYNVIKTNSDSLIISFGALQSAYITLCKADVAGNPTWFNTIDSELGNAYFHNNEIHYIGRCFRVTHSGSQEYISKSVYDVFNQSGKLIKDENIYFNDTNYLSFGSALSFISDNSQIQLHANRQPKKTNPAIHLSMMLIKKIGDANVLEKIISDTNYLVNPWQIYKINQNKFLVTGQWFPNEFQDNNFTQLFLIDSNLNVLNTSILNLVGYSSIICPDALLNKDGFYLYGECIKNGITKPFVAFMSYDLTLMPSSNISKPYDYQCNAKIGDSSINASIGTTIDLSNVALPLGIKNTANNERGNFYIYPNPGTGSIRIASRDNQSFHGLRVYDIMGRQLQEIEIGANAEFDLHLSEGVYFFHLYGKHGHLIQVLKYIQVSN